MLLKLMRLRCLDGNAAGMAFEEAFDAEQNVKKVILHRHKCHLLACSYIAAGKHPQKALYAQWHLIVCTQAAHPFCNAAGKGV